MPWHVHMHLGRQHHKSDGLQWHMMQGTAFVLAFPHRMTMWMQLQEGQRLFSCFFAAMSRLSGSISFDCMMPCWAGDDCIGIKCCRVKWISKHTSFVKLVELFCSPFFHASQLERDLSFLQVNLQGFVFLGWLSWIQGFECTVGFLHQKPRQQHDHV